MSSPRTLYDKIWDKHKIRDWQDGTSLIYIDRHLVHEVTSPQAFEGLRMTRRHVRRPELTLATPDHNVPTQKRAEGIFDEESRVQVNQLRTNCAEFGVPLFDMNDRRQGVVHIVGPEQGFTLPGLTIVCGDSHTSTHGAFGALAFGIGTSDVEHVLASQTLNLRKSLNMKIDVTGKLGFGCTAKDVILTIIGKIGTAGGTGCVIEYTGSTFRDLTMEGRMTICNMSIEGGARAGLIAPDATTFAYLKDRNMAPKGKDWDRAVSRWRSLVTDEGAVYDRTVDLKAGDIAPQVTWGTSPEDVVPVTAKVPSLEDFDDPNKRQAVERSLDYMGLKSGTPMEDVTINTVFIGSCTNGRIEDLREVAMLAKGRKVAESVRAMIVPGSGLVKEQAEHEGLDKIFIEAGFDWREPGCSMCLAMNADRLTPGERAASTSNRNFEGRQGRGGRTHLVSPAMAAAAALTGRLTDVRQLR